MNVLCMDNNYSGNACIMYNKTIGRSLSRRRPVSLPASAGRCASIGRSLCQYWPVSMLASAGLYAGLGRSLCRRRPVSLPVSAGLYAGFGRSLCRRRPVSTPANPFSTVSPCPPGVFFSAKPASQKHIMRIY